MRVSIHMQEPIYSEQKWPVDLQQYNCDPQLSSSELSALANLGHIAPSGKQSWPYASSLHRITRPIEDVLDFTGAQGKTRRAIVLLLLRAMYQRNTAIWGWTEQDWAEVLGASGKFFQVKHKRPKTYRQHVMAVSYLLCRFSDLRSLGQIDQYAFAVKVFGKEVVDTSVQRAVEATIRIGYGAYRVKEQLPPAVCEALLVNRSPYLEHLTVEVLDALRRGSVATYLKDEIVHLSRALVSLGITSKTLEAIRSPDESSQQEALQGVAEEWVNWCKRWRDTSTLSTRSRKGNYYVLLQVGRWCAKHHPEIVSPKQWTRELAAEYVGAVDRMTVGQWAKVGQMHVKKIGNPLTPRAKACRFNTMRVFFRDCQEWEWIERRFDPRRSFATPRSISALIINDPRVIEDDIWAKLLWAGLNLTEEDLPTSMHGMSGKRRHWYPLEMVKAMAIVWLFCGLRSDEWYRLRVGCIRWQREDARVEGKDEVLPKNAVCMFAVPTNKTSTAFTKPVDKYVGEAVALWEQVRPRQHEVLDSKTSELVHFLFAYRGKRVGKNYINDTLIPLLCRKAGAPESDARGNITSHRARSTIATQLFNAKEPMSLFELQKWLGHRLLSSTQAYARINPTKLANSYAKAGYLERNVRTVEVLIDQDAIKNGAAANGESWRFFDLGHGYCTYDFFDQCPHRMACAQCSFYRPKGSSQAQLLEGKANLQRMLQEIPLKEEERAAVEDGIEAMEKLRRTLADVPTPAGPTPSQLTQGEQKMKVIIPLENMRRKK